MALPTRITEFLDKLLTARVLIVLNVLIIILTETVGGGMAFHEHGIIHAIAVLFIFLAVLRMVRRFYVVDPEVRAFITDGMIAMGVFAAAHLAEFIGFTITHVYTDQAYAAVGFFYSISLLFLVMGAEYVIKNYHRTSTVRIWIAAILAGILLGFGSTIILGFIPVSLELDSAWPYALLVLVCGVAGYGIVRMNKVAGLYPWFMKFIRPLRFSIIMITIAAIANIMYEPIVDLGVPDIQIDYITHFTFYIALSVMIVAYGAPLKLGGIHEDVRREMEAMEKEGKA